MFLSLLTLGAALAAEPAQFTGTWQLDEQRSDSMDAVFQAQGCKCPEMLGACCCGCFYTMLCWDPTAGKGGAPENEEMER